MSFEELWWTYESLVLSIGINSLLALSVYLVLATGQLFLAQGAFMAIGAYTSAMLSLNCGLSLPVTLVMAMTVSGLTAFAVCWPMLRLSGVYLGIATIAFGEVLRAIIINSEPLGGALGLNGIPTSASPVFIYGCVLVCIAGCFAAVRSKVGRAMEAIRSDETAAQVLGINVFRYKMAIVVVAAMIASAAGVLNAHSHSSISPEDFSFEATVTILSFAIMGGVSSPVGAVLGAAILTSLPEALRGLADYRSLINGLIIVLVVAFRPEGLVSWRIPKARRHA
ncbi:branched-chain amino acid ABC transporter permease [Xanthobacter sp.]|uniref:branched-chain amino acid ABC transporter permease n=1 Tax=Xanthobacter sp. TaxID=35809 RepID=UPI0035AF485A